MEVELGVQEPQVPDGTDLETEPLSGQKSSQFLSATAATAKSLQSCSTLCDPETAAHQAPRPCDSQGKNTGVGCHFLLQCMKVKSESEVAESCPTPSDPMDCSLPGSSVHGIFQARVLEWVPLPSLSFCLARANFCDPEIMVQFLFYLGGKLFLNH